MISRVDANLVLRPNGRVVEVTGPITQWDADETSATFAVVIAQLQADGTIVLAHGSSVNTYHSGDGAWSAHAHVVGPAGLAAGHAQAFAYASVLNDDGEYEPYPWWVETRLGSAVVHATGEGN
jgi:hypothetical protein